MNTYLVKTAQGNILAELQNLFEEYDKQKDIYAVINNRWQQLQGLLNTSGQSYILNNYDDYSAYFNKLKGLSESIASTLWPDLHRQEQERKKILVETALSQLASQDVYNYIREKINNPQQFSTVDLKVQQASNLNVQQPAKSSVNSQAPSQPNVQPSQTKASDQAQSGQFDFSLSDLYQAASIFVPYLVRYLVPPAPQEPVVSQDFLKKMLDQFPKPSKTNYV